MSNRRWPQAEIHPDNRKARYGMHLEEMERVIPPLLVRDCVSEELTDAVNQLLRYARFQAELGDGK